MRASTTTIFTGGRTASHERAIRRHVHWIALADYKDDAHQRALMLAEERADATIITTDEVLAEYLSYFSAASRSVRSEIAASVQDILTNPLMRVIPQSRVSFLAGLDLYTQRPDQALQPRGLHFDADDAARGADGSPDQ